MEREQEKERHMSNVGALTFTAAIINADVVADVVADVLAMTPFSRRQWGGKTAT